MCIRDRCDSERYIEREKCCWESYCERKGEVEIFKICRDYEEFIERLVEREVKIITSTYLIIKQK